MPVSILAPVLLKYETLIRAAANRVYRVARRTALDSAPQLSRRLGNRIYLKREDQQPVFSYKIRGAYNMMAALEKRAKRDGVIAASAGNHAQGVSLAAAALGVNALIVMPRTTPEIKIEAVARYGVSIKLEGDNYDEAAKYAACVAKKSKRLLIPPYDHRLIIAGQATVAMEIAQQAEKMPDFIFVPVGGGGLIAGVVAHMRRVAPKARIIGVESVEAPCLDRALRAGRRVRLANIGIFADGAAVSQVGAEPFRIVRNALDGMVIVDNDEICAAVKDIFEETRSVAEPAGALALAGLKQYLLRHPLKKKSMVAIFSGANLNFDRFRHIAELAELGEQREVLLAVTIPETPGSFLRFCRHVGSRSITEFNYRYVGAGNAHIFVGVRLNAGTREKHALLKVLRGHGYPVRDLSGDETAKMHIRYMVGGRAPELRKDELLYRFKFPERSGALLHFLSSLGNRWNISLFHYRNHGSAYGRVLMGIEVAQSERLLFRRFVKELQLPYAEETDNVAYRLFLL